MILDGLAGATGAGTGAKRTRSWHSMTSPIGGVGPSPCAGRNHVQCTRRPASTCIRRCMPQPGSGTRIGSCLSLHRASRRRGNGPNRERGLPLVLVPVKGTLHGNLPQVPKCQGPLPVPLSRPLTVPIPRRTGLVSICSPSRVRTSDVDIWVGGKKEVETRARCFGYPWIVVTPRGLGVCRVED
jgi:hypothetical protein